VLGEVEGHCVVSMLEKDNCKASEAWGRQESNSWAAVRVLARDRDAAILIPRRVLRSR